jgi:hypothetical protein
VGALTDTFGVGPAGFTSALCIGSLSPIQCVVGELLADLDSYI